MAISTALVREVLEELADDPEGILKYTGTTGMRHGSSTCPVAKYLSATFPDVFVSIGLFTAQVYDRHVRIPESIQNFITYFDEGFYPDLIED